MFQLIIYVIIAPVTYAFARKPLLVFTYLVILVMGALGGSKLVWMIDLKSIMCERGMFYFNYYAYYLLGAAIALNCNFLATFKRIVAKFTIKAPIIAAVLLVISFLSSLVFEDIIRTPYHRIMIPFVAVGVLLFVAKMKDALRIPLGVSPVLIYCIHPMIGVLFSVLLPPLPMVCVDYMARCVLICGFSCLSVYCLQKYCPRWCYKILSGDR